MTPKQSAEVDGVWSHRLERLVLWPQFTGAEWGLPVNVAAAARVLVGWKVTPAMIDEGVPPMVGQILIATLRRVGTLFFPSALRTPTGAALLPRRWHQGRHFVWKTASLVGDAGADVAADADINVDANTDVIDGIFSSDFFPWSQQAQVVIVAAPETAAALDETHLELLRDPRAFEGLARVGAHAVLLPGVDGQVAGLYFFDQSAGRALEELPVFARARGATCVTAADVEFRDAIRS